MKKHYSFFIAYITERYIRASLLILFLLTPFFSFAQETSGSLQGKVLDSAGHSLPGATVIAIHQPSGTKYGTVTFNDGHYALPNLRIGGPYIVQAQFIGMAPQVKTVAQVMLGEPQTLNFALVDNNRQLSEVVVRAARSGASANNYGTGQNISRDQLRNMPTIARSIQDITRLVPQASKDNSFGGANFRYNNVTIDGAINNDAIGFSPSAGGITGTSGMPGSSTRTNPISLDAIENMQVYLAPYDVKIGNFTGGSINAVTRSGTNTVSGSVYAYGRNAAITGRNHAGDNSRMPSEFYDYQTGFRVGFPIMKDKVFFFTNEEITRRQEPVQQVAGSAASAGILSLQEAQLIRDTTLKRYGFDPGTYGQYNAYSRSYKFFNRLDWNISDKHQLVIRNNTIRSESVNMERDQLDFRFGSIAYRQNNNQTSTVAELKSTFTNRLSNSAIVGYSIVNDYRTPLSDPAFPQVQIVGRTPGATIFFGTDREASIFDMQQKTLEITDNLTWNLGRHRLLVGTHNELYSIRYGFVNAWNGRVDYASVEDFLNNKPSRVRGSYNYSNNDRDNILSNPGAVFNINFLSAYIQDDIHISDRFTVTPGMRLDYVYIPEKQPLSDKVINSPTDPTLGTTYTYTPLNRITNHYLGKVQASPRLGFRYEGGADRRLVIRGGLGLFTGRIPFAWLGYAYYNTGNTYGAFDRRQDNGSSILRGDPLHYDKTRGIAAYAEQNGEIVNDVNGGKTQVDVVDNNFVMPQVLRGSLAVDYTDVHGFKYSVEGMYSKVIKDVMFRQVNQKDVPSYNYYDLVLQRQPIYPSGASGQINPGAFSNVYEMSNTTKGFRYSITGQVSRQFSTGVFASAAYTYGMSTDISNGIRNSMESNWQLNQALNPNNPELANSNFDIRHRIVVNAGYHAAWNEHWASTISVFFSAQSGSPFTYGFVNYTAQGTPQQVSLAYIPNREEAINFFQTYLEKDGRTITAEEQAAAFNNYIDGNEYLKTRRGDFTERNKGRTPWNGQSDLHFAQDYLFRTGRQQHTISFTVDILNLTNLLNSNWGWVYFSPNTYNSTASVGLSPYIPGRSAGGYPLYQFRDPGKPYAVNELASRWQMQLGLRYSF
jgi:hypothetical protein